MQKYHRAARAFKALLSHHIKGLPICFSEVQVKNDVTDNNNKHFVTAFEGECRNIIELREHLKLCFLVILFSFDWRQELVFEGLRGA